MPRLPAPPRDQELIQIVNAALTDAFQKSSQWLACKPGCSQCCHGVFAINQLDAIRLRKGLAELEGQDPERAARIRRRALDTVARLSEDYPGDPVSGVLDETCELYEFRPVMCRTFGPALKSDDDLGHCELCFVGATEEEVIAAEMRPDPDNLEAALLEDLQKTTGECGETIIAFALVRETVIGS